MKLIIIIEPGDGEMWARIDAPYTLLTTVGKTVEEVTHNLKDLIQDHLDHEGKTQAEWQGVKVEDIKFEYVYDLTELFDVLSAVKINKFYRRFSRYQSKFDAAICVWGKIPFATTG